MGSKWEPSRDWKRRAYRLAVVLYIWATMAALSYFYR